MIQLTFHRVSVCMGDDQGNGIQTVELPDDAVLADLIQVILRGGCGNNWPIPYTGGNAYWAIESNIGILAYLSDSDLVAYLDIDKNTPLKDLGIVSTFGSRIEKEVFFKYYVP